MLWPLSRGSRGRRKGKVSSLLERGELMLPKDDGATLHFVIGALEN
jgi:hypothetical protein